MAARKVEVIYFDSFSTALGEMPYRDKSNDEKVKAVLRQTKMFSTFEIDHALAPTITRLFRNGSLKQTGGQYPWTEVEVIE
jgi:predicted RNA-binding protein (virulence factor B family)